MRLCLLVASMVAIPVVSSAEPKIGESLNVHSGILCDTAEQIAAIVTAGNHDFESAQAKYLEYKAQKNERDEPMCWFGRWALATPITSVIALPQFYGIGGLSNAWSVGLKSTDGITGFLLWEEPLPKVTGQNI